MNGLIAVTGATGAVGGRVARRLAERGVAQRLVVRDPARAPRLPGAEVRVASGFGSGDQMRAALAGAGTLFLVPAEESTARVDEHQTAIDAAVAAGVGRIVYLSFLNAAPDATFTLARDHWATEQHIRAAGVPFTFARMSLYLDFIPRMAGSDGVIAGPAGEGRVAVVARDDVADVVAALLASDGHDGRAYDVTGPAALTLAEIAATLAELSGKPISFQDETLAEARASRADFGAPDWQLEAWITTYTAIAAGDLAAVSDTVALLAGHAPRSLAEFVRANPHALDHVHAP